MKKRICTLLLALCLTLGLLPAAAQAAGDGSGTFDTVRWTLGADGGLTVSGTGDLPDGAFAGRTDIVTVTFTGQVARIGRSAFAGCTQLRRVDGFGAVTCVMSQAFADCTALTELPLPDDVAWVEPRLCENCTALQNIVLPAAMTEVPRGLLRGCTGLRRVTLQGAVTAVGNGAFAGCDALADVYFTGTRAQWDAVAVGANNARLTAAAVHLSAPAHTYPEAWTVVRAPTCTDDGRIAGTCTVCGYSMDTVLPAYGHIWNSGTLLTAPEGVRCGIVEHTCSRCNGTGYEVLAPEIWAYEQFGDVDPTLWSYEGIQFCVMMGYMSGMDTHVFAPRGVTTRAQLVQILYNFVGGPAVTGETPFTDLTANWYKDAVLWAYQTGVSAGTSETTFAPNDPVTREQVAVLLYEFADKVLEIGGAETPADLSQFPDGDQVSSWAREAMADAVALGIINGTKVDDQVFLAPQGSATRDQIATMFEGFCASLA